MGACGGAVVPRAAGCELPAAQPLPAPRPAGGAPALRGTPRSRIPLRARARPRTYPGRWRQGTGRRRGSAVPGVPSSRSPSELAPGELGIRFGPNQSRSAGFL